jgi:cyanate lyase
VSDRLQAEIDARRRDVGLSWGALAERIGGDPVQVTAALLGQHPLAAEQAQRAAAVLGLAPAAAARLTEIPAASPTPRATASRSHSTGSSSHTSGERLQRW